MITECPNCSSIWGVGSEEWEWQQCDCCGWPDNEEYWGEDEYEDWNDNDFDEVSEEKNPNDSRNL